MMKRSKTIAATLKKQRFVLLSASVLLLSITMLVLFPREEHLALSTAFAVLFWLSLILCMVSVILSVRNRGKPAKDKPAGKNKTI